MKKANILLSTSLLLSAGQVFANCNKHTCEGVSNVVFSSVVANDSDVKVKFHEGTSATLDCNLDADQAAPLNQQSTHFRSMQSMLLTAVAANLPVLLHFDNASTACIIESVEIKVVE